MRVEISTLFHLSGWPEKPVERAPLGDGLHIEKCDGGWLEEVRAQCPMVKAREMLEYMPLYTHRFFKVVSDEDSSPTELTQQEKQVFYRITILARIIKPTSIAYDNVWIKSIYFDDGQVKHYGTSWVNGLCVAFVSEDEAPNTITSNDALQMADLWDRFVYLHDNEPIFRRIIRALRSHEYAHHIFFVEQSHSVMHSALESLIYFDWKRTNRAQIVGRLPILLPTLVTPAQAEAIYKLHNDFKHESQALFQPPFSASGVLTQQNKERLDSAVLLRKCVRELILRAITDVNFANTLCDHSLMKQNYGVMTSQGIA